MGLPKARLLAASGLALLLAAGCYYDKFTKVDDVAEEGTGGNSSSGGNEMGGSENAGGESGTGGSGMDSFTIPNRRATTTQGDSVVINLMAGLDEDASFVSASDESEGVPESLKTDFEPSNNGVLTFDPNPDFWGVYEGTYTVESPNGNEVSANIRIVVVPKDIDLSIIESGYGGFVVDGDDGDQLGTAIAHTNIDNDNFDDLILGAPGAGSNVGRVGLVRGSRNPSSLAFADDANLVQFFVGDGSANGARAGATVAGADLDGDDFGDIIIGAPAAGTGHGRVYVAHGAIAFAGVRPDITLANTLPGDDYTVLGIASHVGTGRAVGAGLLNNDARPDLLFVTNEGTPRTGALRGVLTPGDDLEVNTSDLSLLGSQTGGLTAEASFAVVGDIVADDGIDEVLLATGAGVVLMRGFNGSWAAPDLNAANLDGTDGWIGSTAVDNVSKKVAAAGNFDAAAGADMAHCDGVDECLIVSWTDPGTFDLDVGWTVTGFAGGAGNAPRVARGGDFNGDGFDDLLFGENDGAYVVWGRESLPGSNLNIANVDEDGVNLIPTTADAIGTPVMLGDVNGDGLGDIGIPVPGFDSGKGRVYVVFGTPASAD